MYLISDKLIELVERHSDEIVKRWITRISKDPAASSYAQNNIQDFAEKAKILLEHLGKWVSYETTKEEIEKRYAAEGIESFKDKIPLCEVIRWMHILRATLWLFVVYESAFDSAFELNRMKELSDRVILFFDRAIYYLIRGYMEEMNRKIKDMWSLKQGDTDQIFFFNSFHKQ